MTLMTCAVVYRAFRQRQSYPLRLNVERTLKPQAFKVIQCGPTTSKKPTRSVGSLHSFIFGIKLKGASNWNIWKFTILIALKSRELFDVVSGKECEPEDELEKKRWKNFKAQELLVTRIDEGLMVHLLSCGTSSQMWTKLLSIYERQSKVLYTRGANALTKTMKLSPKMAALVGQDKMARHEVVKKVWAIIKERNLYDPNDKQYTICDDDLYKVFGVKRFCTLAMLKYLKNHFIN